MFSRYYEHNKRTRLMEAAATPIDVNDLVFYSLLFQFCYFQHLCSLSSRFDIFSSCHRCRQARNPLRRIPYSAFLFSVIFIVCVCELLLRKGQCIDFVTSYFGFVAYFIDPYSQSRAINAHHGRRFFSLTQIILDLFSFFLEFP